MIVHVQALSLLIVFTSSVLSGGPLPGTVRGHVPSWEHIESIDCRDGATGIEFAPLGICFDLAGNLYVVDSDNSRVYRADRSTGAFSLFSECPAEYPACEFIDIEGSRAGGIYASERSEGLIVELDQWGEPGAYLQAGEGVAGIGEGNAGRVLAAMSISGTIRRVDFDTESEALETVIKHGDGNAYPVDCGVLEDGTIIVTDSSSRQVLFLSDLGEIGGGVQGFSFESPFGVSCLDDRFILVTDSEHGLVAVFDLKGDFLFTLGEGILEVPTFLDSTPEGLVCVSDAGRMTVEVFRIGAVSAD
jgi:hypothetical protein